MNLPFEELLTARQTRAEAVHERIISAREKIRQHLAPDTPEWLRGAFDELHAAHHVLGGDPFDMHMRAALDELQGRVEDLRAVCSEYRDMKLPAAESRIATLERELAEARNRTVERDAECDKRAKAQWAAEARIATLEREHIDKLTKPELNVYGQPSKFKKGDAVYKTGDVYSGPGRVFSVFLGEDQHWRYVVGHQINQGKGRFYHIYGEGQLRKTA